MRSSLAMWPLHQMINIAINNKNVHKIFGRFYLFTPVKTISEELRVGTTISGVFTVTDADKGDIPSCTITGEHAIFDLKVHS